MRRVVLIAVLSLVAGIMGYKTPYPVVSPIPTCRPYHAHDKCERGTYNLVVKSIEPETYGVVMVTIRATCVRIVDVVRYRITEAELYSKGIYEFIEVAEMPIEQTTVCRME